MCCASGCCMFIQAVPYRTLQAEAAAGLSGEARQQLAAAVVAGVSSRYLHLADDTLRCCCLL